ncbi:MAG: hypothetical protein F6K38_00350 [Moorea sp. SIO3B2]|nr:hypothetical protein [Moorena sp. SIO3B2]
MIDPWWAVHTWVYPNKLIFLWHCPPYICSIVIHPLVGSAYLGVPKQINLSVALPTLHLHCPPYICSIVIHPLLGSAYLGVPKQINLSVALPTLHLFYCDSSVGGQCIPRCTQAN